MHTPQINGKIGLSLRLKSTTPWLPDNPKTGWSQKHIMQLMQKNPPRTVDPPMVPPHQPLFKSLASTALRSGLLLVGLLGVQLSAHADNLTTYNIVADYIDNTNSSGAIAINGASNICSVASVGPFATSVQANIQISAWSSPSSGSTIFGGLQTTTGFQSSGSTGTLSSSEAFYSRTLSYSTSSTSAVGIYTNSLPSGGSTNNSFKYRNYRVQFFTSSGSRVTSSYPSQLVYTNIANNGTYTGLPTATDPTTGATFTGFQGTATPVNPTGFPITKVYMSLQQPNGLFWGGPTIGWSHLKINHEATRSVLNQSTQQVRWTKVGNGFWPSGSNLPSGQYTLSTMARCTTQGGSGTAGPGLLNTIQFSIGGAPTPTPTSSVLSAVVYNPQAAKDLSTGYSFPGGTTQTITANYIDMLGYTNINEVFVLARLNAEPLSGGLVGYGDALHFRYVRSTNKVYIISTDGTSWLGVHPAASDNLLLNGGTAGMLRCLSTTINPAFGGNNNVLQVNWAIEPTTSYLGTKYIRLGVFNNTGAVVAITDAKKDGRWNITAPAALAPRQSAPVKSKPSFNQASFPIGNSGTQRLTRWLSLVPTSTISPTLIDTANQPLLQAKGDVPTAFVIGGKFDQKANQFELSFNTELNGEVASNLGSYSATIDGQPVGLSAVKVAGSRATLTFAPKTIAKKNVEVTFNALKSSGGDTIPNSSVLVDVPAPVKP